MSQDASTIRFIPPPNVNGPLTVNGVISAAAPDVVFSPATDSPLQTPLIDTVDVTYSTVTPTLGQTVTLTVVEPLIDLVVDSLIFPGQLPGRAPGPQNVVVAADSNSLTFDTPPNADGSGTVVNFAFPGGYLLALPTRPNLTAPNVGTGVECHIRRSGARAPAGSDADRSCWIHVCTGCGGHDRRQRWRSFSRRGRR